MSRNGQVIFRFAPKQIGAIPISSRNAGILRNTMREVVRRGTGIAASVKGIPAAGKTGTAENPGLAHAWFMCFAPYDDPRLVVASFVEHGEHGDRVTAYIAREILKWYRDNMLTDYQEKAVEKTGQI